MKRIVNIIGLFAVLSMVFVSCLSKDFDWYNGLQRANAIVTVKTNTDGTPFFQLDDSTSLNPVEWTNPYKSETRALLLFSYEDEKSPRTTNSNVNVLQIDSIVTKDAECIDKLSFSGLKNDPIDVFDDWMTVCEDGYLTLHFVAAWGNTAKPHKISLYFNEDNPYELYLRHDKNGDVGTTPYNGIIAFRLKDIIPAPEGKIAKIKLNWNSFDGSTSTEFVYSTK